jgi:hypothetical protein
LEKFSVTPGRIRQRLKNLSRQAISALPLDGQPAQRHLQHRPAHLDGAQMKQQSRSLLSSSTTNRVSDAGLPHLQAAPAFAWLTTRFIVVPF